MAEDEEVAEMILDNNDRMSSQETAFLKKYFTLRKKCEQMQQANEKIVNRLQHVKKIIKKYKRERRFLVQRLDDYGDNYRDVPVPVMWEEDQLYSFLRPPPPYPDTSLSADPASLPPSDSLGPPTDSLAPPTDGLAPPTLSPGLGLESLSTVHPILAGLGGGESRTVHTPSPSPSSTKHRRVKTEKDKDPNAPKKPANAFLMFCQQQRNAVLEEYHKEKSEEISHQELTRRLAHRWKALGQEGKRVYYEMYEREKERYDREVKEYTAKEVNTMAMEEEVNVTDNPVNVMDLLKSELL